jgi:hypothetical protein
MLDRLFAAMLNGPSMNCRPHAVAAAAGPRADRQAQGHVARRRAPCARRQGRFAQISSARVPVPQRRNTGDESAADVETEAQVAWADQQFVRNKLRLIADDARTYEQDTGVCALNLGFPLLSLPPGTFGGRFGIAPSRRVLAPIAFIPLTLMVKTGAQQAVEILPPRRRGDHDPEPGTARLAGKGNRQAAE